MRVAWLNTFARNGWRPSHVAFAIGLALAGVLATFEAWSDLVRIAISDEESSHALLVPVIVAWLVWARRGRLRHCRPVGQWIGPVIAAAGAGLFLLGEARLIESFWHGGAVMVAVGCCLTILGKDVLRNFLPALLVLVFLVPIPGRIRQKIAVPLQSSTAMVTQGVCEFGGLSVERSGNLLRFNRVDVAIGEACNGMRMTFALVLVSFAFALTTPLRGSVRVLVVLLSPLSAVVANVIRLVPTVWVYGTYSPTAAERFHDISGWLMLFVAFLALMGTIRLLQWLAVPVTPYPFAYE
ncbi:MAG TPA: exosortase/archaeosortase family protein [Tepidisphaeraceae bacterium]|nr:exosortase/archaeosortase family protein [Tepidisphaeraceae bacterium]